MSDFQAYLFSVTIIAVYALTMLGVTLRELIKRMVETRERNQ